MGLIGVCGYVVIRSAEGIIKGAVNAKVKATNQCAEEGNIPESIFEINVDTTIEAIDLVLHKGDKYRVLESDKDTVLIEVIGDTNNPYAVSVDFLRNKSNYDR